MKEPIAAVDPTKNPDEMGDHRGTTAGGNGGGGGGGGGGGAASGGPALWDRSDDDSSIRSSGCGGGTTAVEERTTANRQERCTTTVETNRAELDHDDDLSSSDAAIALLRRLDHLVEDLDRTISASASNNTPRRLQEASDQIRLLTAVWRYVPPSLLLEEPSILSQALLDQVNGCGIKEAVEEETAHPNDCRLDPGLHRRLRMLEGRCAAAVLAVAEYPSLPVDDHVSRRFHEVRLVQVGVVINRGCDNGAAIAAEEDDDEEEHLERDTPSYRLSHLDLSFLDFLPEIDGNGTDSSILGQTELQRAVDQYWHFWLEHQQSHRRTTTQGVGCGDDSNAAASSDHPPSPTSARTLVQLFTDRGILSELAQQARNRFLFGTTTAIDNDPGKVAIVDVAVAHTRLFLGKTVPYLPDPGPPAYLQDPSRARAALRLASVLGAALRASESLPSLPLDVWEALVPVADALLDATPHEWNARGAALVCDLLDAFEGSPALEDNPSATVAGAMDKWLERLRASAQICRDGPALAVLGVAHARVLQARQRLALNAGEMVEATTHSVQWQRREACQKWLTILHRNPTARTNQPHLVLGLLSGTSHLLHDLVMYGRHCGERVDVGRLGLSALLPLLSVDPDHPPDVGVQSNIQVAALVALHNLLLAAHPIVPRHSGQILCHLLAVCGSLAKQEGQALEGLMRLAIRVTAVAATLCQSGTNNNDLVARMCRPGQVYHESFVCILRLVEQESRRLMGTNSDGLPGAPTAAYTPELLEEPQRNAVRPTGDSRTFIAAS